ncbi:MAG: hypothetical protein M1540_07040 [Candidatus Bathyarchaeota archaeon]|nr:hypothetical protein [Candidatus Bathyarchaeota archaeon]
MAATSVLGLAGFCYGRLVVAFSASSPAWQTRLMWNSRVCCSQLTPLPLFKAPKICLLCVYTLYVAAAAYGTPQDGD